jgi:hypothetical protein
MEIQKPHHWPSTLKEAQAIQDIILCDGQGI